MADLIKIKDADGVERQVKAKEITAGLLWAFAHNQLDEDGNIINPAKEDGNIKSLYDLIDSITDLSANIVMVDDQSKARNHESSKELVSEVIAAGATKYIFLPLATYKHLVQTIDITAGALGNVEIDSFLTLNKGITLPPVSTTGWTPCSLLILGGTETVAAGDNLNTPYIYNNNLGVKYLMIRIVNNDATNSVTFTYRALATR